MITLEDNLDRLAEELQNQILSDAQKVYSEKVIENFTHPKNVGRMNVSDAAASVKGHCGDTLEIYLIIRDKKIEDIKFFTDGCGTTVACGSITTQLVKGKVIKDALNISPAYIIEELEGLPEEYVHCAILSAITLYKAIAEYLIMRQMY